MACRLSFENCVIYTLKELSSHCKSTPSSLTATLTVPGSRRICTTRIAQALGDCYHLQVVLLGPADQPRCQRLDGALVRLMHKRNVAVAARACLLELLLALLRRLAVPVFGVDIVGDDAVAELLHGREDRAARLEVRGTHIGRLDTDDVDERGFQLGHLGRQGRRREGSDVWVRPGMRGDLMARFVGVLKGRLLVVDAAWGLIRLLR